MPELELKIRQIIDSCRYGEETILMDTKKAARQIRLLFELQSAANVHAPVMEEEYSIN